MSRRTVNVVMKFAMVLDDDQEGIPWVDGAKIPGLILNGFKGTRGLTEILPGATVSIGLDRASSQALRKRDREANTPAVRPR